MKSMQTVAPKHGVPDSPCRICSQKSRLRLDFGDGERYNDAMSTKISAEMLEQVRSWAAQGVDLNGIQKNLANDCGVHMTYMDLRFLLLDNGIEIASTAEAPKPAPAPAPEEKTTPEPTVEEDDVPGPPAAGKVKISMDEIQLPGALLSGKANFPGGANGAWFIDQMGRFGWRELSGTPSPQEMQAFQVELTQLLSQG